MAPTLLPRSNGADISSPTIPEPLYIVGFILAGCFVLASVSWFALRYMRKVRGKRALAEGQGEQGFVTEIDRPNHILSAQTANSVIFPQRAIVPRTPHIVTPSRHDDGPSSETHPTSPSPRPRPRALSGLNPAHPRHSRASTGYSLTSPRFPSGLGSRSSSRSSSSFQGRSVRQLFQPVLPDELALTRVGEHLVVLQSFDDGWCLAARDNSRNSRSSLSIFIRPQASSRVESQGEFAGLGFVPAWVFVKPTQGMRVERPVRSSSAGSHQTDERTPQAAISWAIFGT